MVRKFLIFPALFAIFAACSAPAPNTGCKNDQECGGGRECRQQKCVPKGSVSCATDSDCNPAEAALGLHAPGACETLGCDSASGYCKYAIKPVNTPCEETDTMQCTTYQCDGVNTVCETMVKTGCAIDSLCVGAGKPNPTNSCQVCDPNHPFEWSNVSDSESKDCSSKSDEGTCYFRVCESGSCQPKPKSTGACSALCIEKGTGQCQATSTTESECQGTPLDCSDGQACTDDSCDKASGCKHANNTAACDDSVTCTVSDGCNGGKCVGTPNDATCSDDNGCTNDGCDLALGCTHTSNSAKCDDGDLCTSGESCKNGACIGIPKDCDDKNECTADSCSKGTCSHTNLPSSATCSDDGLACTDDVCGSGSCVHSVQSSACKIAGVCLPSGATSSDGCLVCDPGKSQSDWTAASVGASCQKGAICQIGTCTSAHTCEVSGTAANFCFIGGVCVEGGASNPGNSCETCVTTKQNAWSLAADNTACDSDDVACTEDVCKSGQCTHIPGPCSGGGECAIGTCDLKNGCVTLPLPATTSCDSDGSVCTLERCGSGTGTCDTVIGNQNCNDGQACTTDACDPKTGCSHTPVNSACDDGNACTSDVCSLGSGCSHPALSGACSLPGDVTCSADTCNAGVCKAGVSAGQCLIAGQCVNSGVSTAEGCQHCDPGQSLFAWTNSTDGTACSDGKSCHVNQCKSGTCDHSLAGGWCEIDSTCQLSGAAKSDNPCLLCTPATSTSAWSSAPGSTPCTSDGTLCTVDHCSGSVCVHDATDSLCTPTPDTCTVPLCKPADLAADATTGCAPVDDCAVGHHCDTAAKACLTDAPIAIVTAGGDHPNPTNPALVRHVLDAKKGTMRTWLVFQTDTCATATANKWTIANPAGLRAAIIDSVVAAPADKATIALAPVPIVTLPTALGWADSTKVCQGYPVVARDPGNGTEAWLSWLEAAPGQTVSCLTAGGQGGLLRLGRLDAGALPAGGIWTNVAGDANPLGTSALCTSGDSFPPSFLTEAFGILPLGGTDPLTEKLVSVRPSATSLNANATVQQVRIGDVLTNSTTSESFKTGPFPTIHPVLVDTLAATPSAERFFVIALNEKFQAGTTTHSVWATALSETGVDSSPVEWSTGTTPASGSGTGDLKDITAVCGLDASVDSAGNVGVALVVRRAGKDAVLLVTRASGSASGVVSTIKEQASSDPGCAIGISAVRIAGRGAGDFVLEWLDTTGPTDATKGGVYLTSSANNVPVQLATLTAWDTDGSAAPLAWRGLGGLVTSSGGVVTTAIEGRSGTSRTIFVHSLKL